MATEEKIVDNAVDNDMKSIEDAVGDQEKSPAATFMKMEKDDEKDMENQISKAIKGRSSAINKIA